MRNVGHTNTVIPAGKEKIKNMAVLDVHGTKNAEAVRVCHQDIVILLHISVLTKAIVLQTNIVPTTDAITKRL